MAFEPIGPYALRRIDRLVAATVIAFVLGPPITKIKCLIFLCAPLCLAIWSAAQSEPVGIAVGLFLPAFWFVIGPLLASNKASRAVVLRMDPEGLAFDTEATRNVYKWLSLGRMRLIAGRFMVMIDARCAVIVPAGATSPDNLNALMQTIAEGGAVS